MYDKQEWEERTRSHIRAHLERSIPPLIRRYRRAGRPRVRSYALYLGEHGDNILFPKANKGNDTEAVDKLAEGITVLAFCPGGIRIFVLEYDATKIEADGRDELQQLIEDFNRIFYRRHVATT